MGKNIHILGLVGSLRQHSYNRGLLQACLGVMPPGAVLKICEIHDIPLFNQDGENPLPSPVKRLKEGVRAADAILIATPEYNYSYPGVLKNVIDWASRPYGDSAWNNKPVAIIGASLGVSGTQRAQHHLRQVLACLNVHVINQPEFLLGNAQKSFDAKGCLIDEKAQARLAEVLRALVAWTKKIA